MRSAEHLGGKPFNRMTGTMADGMEPAELLPVGTKLFRRYIIDGVIARGGYGITYEAHDERSNARLALKEYFPGALSARASGSAAISPKNKACGALFFLGSEMFYRQHLALTSVLLLFANAIGY